MNHATPEQLYVLMGVMMIFPIAFLVYIYSLYKKVPQEIEVRRE